MKDYKYELSGYIFQTSKQYEDARKEYEAILYIREKTDFSDPIKLRKVYDKLNEKPSFHTVLGFQFMQEMYSIITKDLDGKKNDIKPVKVEPINSLKINLEESGDRLTTAKVLNVEEKYHTEKRKFRNACIINVFLAVIILIMIVIARNSDYNVFSDYEENIVNKYASWADELTQREQAIREKEKELGMSE